MNHNFLTFALNYSVANPLGHFVLMRKKLRSKLFSSILNYFLLLGNYNCSIP